MNHNIPQSLLDTISKMEADEKVGISIVNLDNLNKQLPFSNLDKITQDFGGVFEMLESFAQKGIKKIQIIENRKHGNSHVKTGVYYSLNLSADSEVKPQEQPEEKSEVMQSKKTEMQINGDLMHHTEIIPGLKGVGLNAAASLGKIWHYDKVESERDAYKNELKESKAEIEKLRRKLQKKKSGIKERDIIANRDVALAKSAEKFAPFIFQMFNKGQNAVPLPVAEVPLAGAVSEVKQDAMKILNFLNDDQAYNIGILMQNMAQNEQIETEIVALLNKYQLIN